MEGLAEGDGGFGLAAGVGGEGFEWVLGFDFFHELGGLLAELIDVVGEFDVFEEGGVLDFLFGAEGFGGLVFED